MLVQIGDKVVMKKAHACGENVWGITRVGADIGLKCLHCGHRIMLGRAAFNRSVKQLIPPPEE